MRSFYAALISVAFIATSAYADDAALKTTLQGRYAAMKSAMASHDATAIGALLAPNFTSVDVSGAVENGADMVREVLLLPKDPSKTSVTTILSVTSSGTTANVRQRYDMKKVKQAADGTKQNIELVTVSDDTWIQSGGKWLIQRTATKQMDYFINGQPAMHRTAGSQ
jgi:hypothetical protein